MSQLQEKRSAETREALMQATLKCLHHEGYANTTTHKIAELAGVSRGARQHHFTSKSDLVIAALEYVLDKRQEESEAVVASLPAEKYQNIDKLIDATWQMFQSPTFFAWLELAIASRSDPALRESVHRATKAYDGKIDQLWSSIFGEEMGLAYRDLASIINGYLEACAIGSILIPGGDPGVSEKLDLLKRVAHLLINESPRTKRKVRHLR